MTVIQIVSDYAAYSTYDSDKQTCDKYETGEPSLDGVFSGLVTTKVTDRCAWRFPLNNLPADAQVSKVEFLINCRVAGGADGVWGIFPYGANGQDDPSADPCTTFRNRCYNGNQVWTDRYMDTTEFRTTTSKTLDLGTQACTDVENAKSAVNRFSIGCVELNEDDAYCKLDTHQASWARCKLQITYTVPAVAGYSYSNGLVSVSVFAMSMRKAILSVCGRVAG